MNIDWGESGRSPDYTAINLDLLPMNMNLSAIDERLAEIQVDQKTMEQDQVLNDSNMTRREEAT